jgi:hypothetical protein
MAGLNIYNPLALKNTTGPASTKPSIKHDVGQLFGHALNALPGYSTLGANITNPNINYKGALNPPTPSNNYYTPPISGGGSGDGSGSANYTDQSLYDPTQGGLYNTSGGSIAYQNNLADQLRSIISAYDSLSGGVDSVSNDAINQYNKQYDTQSNDLNNEFASASNQLSGQYGARGLADSSYYGNAQDEAKHTYDTNVQSLVDQRNQNLASIGQQAAAAKANYGGQKGQYSDILNNIGNYDQSSLNSLGSSLPGALSDVNQAKAGQGTQAQFLQAIQGLPALQNNGGQQLQAQLQKLSTTGAPGFAKQQIAQGLISQAQLQDPNANTVWQNYFNQLQGA